MKVLGTKGTSVIAELSYAEWVALGGKTIVRGYYQFPDTSSVPDVREIAAALRSIRDATRDLKHIRAAFQAFLMITQPDAISDVLAACGVAAEVEEIPKDICNPQD